MQTNLEIYNETKTTIPAIDFFALKNKILGKNFDLQISVLLPKNSKKINWKQRKQKYVPNTLSFKYSPNSGEIILTPEIIEQEDYEILISKNQTKQTIEKYSEKFLYLTIHSMLHLTDLDHGSKMDKLEEKYFLNFK